MLVEEEEKRDWQRVWGGGFLLPSLSPSLSSLPPSISLHLFPLSFPLALPLLLPVYRSFYFLPCCFPLLFLDFNFLRGVLLTIKK